VCDGRAAWWLGALVALVAPVAAWGVEPAPGAEPARWAAADAVVYVEAPRPARLVERVLDDRFQQALGALPPYARFLKGQPLETARKVADTVAAKLGTTREQALRDLVGGGLSLAVEGDPGERPRAFLAITPADAAFLDRFNEALLALARSHAEAQGKPDPARPFEHRGIRAYETHKGAYAIVRGRLLIADSTETLEKVLDRVLDGMKPGEALADDARWKSCRDRLAPDTMAWSLVRLDRLRAEHPERFGFRGEARPVPTLLFGSWLEAARKADWVSAALHWSDERLAAELRLALPPGAYPDAFQGFLPPREGGPAPLRPPGTIASLSLWRDLARIWEARADLFPPAVVQQLAKLDGFAGQFFGGRDFGTGVLGALANDWRLVVAEQDFQAMDPVPDLKLPAFALVVGLKPGDDDFAVRLRVAFQSFVGLANLGAAQTKAPPLELGTETVEGASIATARFLLPKGPRDPKEPVHVRHNLSPAAAHVGDHFVLSSSTPLARALVHALKAPAGPATGATLAAQADGVALARLVAINRTRLVMQNMLEKGHDKPRAEADVDALMSLLRFLDRARLVVHDQPDALTLELSFALGW
jgi:hypothetical protein